MKAIVGLDKSQTKDAMTALANDLTDGDVPLLSEKINEFFHSVSGDMPPLTENNKYSNFDAMLPDEFIISVSEVEKSLSKIKPNKAAGPDRIEAWMLRDLAPILAPPITAIYNSSLREGYIPSLWKSANVCPLPKKNPPPPKKNK